MITVATVCRSGSIYTPELWVDRLYHQVRKAMPAVAWRFRCLTDTPMPWLFSKGKLQVRAWDGYATEPLQQDWPGWWSKLELFRPGLFDGLVLYLDLDTLVLGSLEPLLSYGGRFAALSDFYTPEIAASGVMLWQADDVHLYERALRDSPTMSHARSDHWWNEFEKPDRLQDLFPGLIGSYKADSLQEGPGEFSVVCFHGVPKQHQVRGTWVEEAWKGVT